MWFEYELMTENDKLVYFAEEYRYHLLIFLKSNIDDDIKINPYFDVFSHKQKKTFIRRMEWADEFQIKYDDYFAFGFDFFLRNSHFIKFYGISSFGNNLVEDYILEQESNKYDGKFKFATSYYFSASHYLPDNNVMTEYQRYVLMMIIGSDKERYINKVKDFVRTDKISLLFLNKHYPNIFDKLIKKFPQLHEQFIREQEKKP
jgi:hypothetical protein